MSSEPSIAAVEHASGVEGEATHAQGGAISVDPVPQATQPNVNLHDYDIDILQEQSVTENGAMHSLPQGDAKPNPQNSTDPPGEIPIQLPAPRTFPKPDFDPFERLLKPMLEQDTVQCSAWKDEVQNILIFAGLFSAVVTAFIIESYQRLQPDSNDVIVGLLAHIAEKLDNPSINGTAPVASIISATSFSPSRSAINVNVFWFISLVLSLTAALIGIITLQWLREHQRYDNTLKPQQTMAILNARLDSLQEWYVPQIFAGLPLLLQGALVLFFAGMIEFLFALRLEVAVLVTLSICVPLIFLIATTLLPMLQLCILPDPFRLSINNNVPSPCPYKSPQSLIFRRIGVHSKLLFKFFASIVACAYLCVVEIVCLVRKLAGSQPLIFRSQRPYLENRQYSKYPDEIRAICEASSRHWTSIDMSWLSSRTTHAISLQQAKSCYNNNHVTSWTIHDMSDFPAEVYDCTRRLSGILNRDRTRVDHYALYHCVETLFSNALDHFQERRRLYSEVFLIDIGRPETTDFCFGLGQLLCDVYVPEDRQTDPLFTATFIEDAILHESPDGSQIITAETMCAAFMASRTPHMHSSLESVIETIADDGASLLITKSLRIKPERLFTMSSGDMWLPATLQNSAYLKENSSPPVIDSLCVFLERCSTMRPNSQLALRPAPASTHYGGIAAYMNVIFYHQTTKSIREALAHLTHLCNTNATPNLIQEKPFLMIAACFYIDAIKAKHLITSIYSDDSDDSNSWLNSRPLQNIIIEACGIGEGGTNEFGDIEWLTRWSLLDKAIDAIYNHHNPSAYPINNPNTSTPTNLHDSHDNV